jgi:5-enolpyruvylshikimate-3-phosphate synthase
MASLVDLDLPDDHRMVMTGTLFLLYHNGGTIRPAEAVNKSYPSFFEIISLQSRMN